MRKWLKPKRDKGTIHAFTLQQTATRMVAPMPTVEPVRHGRWIPCSERLPEKAGFYLVATPRGLEILEFPSGDKLYRGTPCFLIEALWKVSGYVTHWMPLPEPPEKGENENGL